MKVLKPDLAAMIAGERFLAEIKTTAALLAGAPTLQDWTVDGQLVFTPPRNNNGVREILVVPIDGSASPEPLIEPVGGGRVWSVAMVPDGRSVVITRRTSGAGTEELIHISLDGESSVTPLQVPRNAGGAIRPRAGRVSPDGQWIAMSDISGRAVHVIPIDGGGSMQVSESDGRDPVWGPDSRRLYYSTASGVTVAELRTNPALGVLSRQLAPGIPRFGRLHDVSPDGRTFLVSSPRC